MLRLLYYSTAFLTGACVMALEMVGFRLFAPYFGYSVYVTGSLISVILMAMSLGYLMGGWLADRSTTARQLFVCIFVGGLLTSGVAWVAPWLLHQLRMWSVVNGTLVGAVALFFFPMLTLSVSSPYLIKLLAKDSKVGMTAGQIVALSTVGSIFGTLLATFWMLPNLGVRFSLLTLSGTLILLAIVGWIRSTKFAALGLLAFGLLMLPSLNAPELLPSTVFKTLYQGQSLYSQLKVYYDKHKRSVFVMPSHRFIHSEKKDGSRFSKSEQDAFSVGALLSRTPRRVLFLGLGAGTSLLQLHHFFPTSKIVGVDIDPTMVWVGKRFFGLKKTKQTKLVIQDARRYLHQSNDMFDMIAINVTAGGPYIPFHLATKEAFSAMAKKLNPKGWLLMNVVDPSPKRHITRCIMKALRPSLPYTYWVPFGANTIVMGSREKLPTFATLWKSDVPKKLNKLRSLTQTMLQKARPFQATQACPLWTDNRSTLEALTYITIQNSKNQ